MGSSGPALGRAVGRSIHTLPKKYVQVCLEPISSHPIACPYCCTAPVGLPYIALPSHSPTLPSSLPYQVRLDPAYLLGSLRPLPLSAADRTLAQQALAEGTRVGGREGGVG